MAPTLRYRSNEAQQTDVSELLALAQAHDWSASFTNGAQLVRGAIRLLYQRELAKDEGLAWFLVRDGEAPRLLELPAQGRGEAGKTRSVTLSEQDTQRFDALADRLEERGKAGVVRTAIAHLSEVLKAYATGQRLVESTDRGTPRGLNLGKIVNDPEPEPQQELTTELAPQTPLTTVRPRSVPPFASGLAQDLFVVLKFCADFNAWVAGERGKVSNEIERSLQEPATPARRQRIDELVRRLALPRLLARYVASSKAVDDAQTPSSELSPAGWKDERSAKLRVELGSDAVASYLAQLQRSELTAELDDEPTAEREDLPPGGWWRHWARNRSFREKGRPYLEGDVAISWSSVLQHHLARKRESTPAMAAHDLRRWLVSYFGLNHQDRLLEVLHRTCAYVNRTFFDDAVVPTGRLHQGSRMRVERSDLLANLDAIAREQGEQPGRSRTEEPTDSANTARGMHLALQHAGVLTTVHYWPDRDGQHRSWDPTAVKPRERAATVADFSAMRAYLFGVPSSIAGLSHILNGGIVPHTNIGRVTLLSGAPGSGKTSLAMHLAADAAARGRIAFYLGIEERPEVLRERLLFYGLLSGRFDVVDSAGYERILQRRSPLEGGGDRGILVLLGATTKKETFDLINWIKRSKGLEGLKRKDLRGNEVERFRWRVIVVDSIDAMQSPGVPRTQGKQREYWAKVIRAIEDARFWGIFVCGTDSKALPTLSHLVDTLVQLHLEQGALRRSLEVVKSRKQPFDGGRHLFEIRPGRGVRVYPNLASIQRAIHSRPRPALDMDRIIPLPPSVGEQFKSTYLVHGASSRDVDSALGILQGSSVLVYGPQKSGKSAFLLDFCARPLQLINKPDVDLGPTGGVVVLSFRITESEFVNRVRATDCLAERMRNNIGDLRMRWYAPGDLLSPEHVLGNLYRLLQRSKRERLPVERVIIDGIDGIAHSPRLASEPSFFPTLLAMLAAEGVTSMFVAGEQDGRCAFKEQYGQDLDYVFHLRRIAGEECKLTMLKNPFRVPSNLIASADFLVNKGELAPLRRAAGSWSELEAEDQRGSRPELELSQR